MVAVGLGAGAGDAALFRTTLASVTVTRRDKCDRELKNWFTCVTDPVTVAVKACEEAAPEGAVEPEPPVGLGAGAGAAPDPVVPAVPLMDVITTPVAFAAETISLPITKTSMFCGSKASKACAWVSKAFACVPLPA